MNALALSVALTLRIRMAPLATHAQSVAKTPRIGMLTPTFAPNPMCGVFRQGLCDLGSVEGQRIPLEYRFADGRFERLPALAAALVRLKVEGILAEGGQATAAAQHATGTIPIVLPAVPDPVGQGLVASLARPGGNTTGGRVNAPECMGKRLELLKEAVPGGTRVAYRWHPSRTRARALQELETAARALGVQLHLVEVRDPSPFDQAFVTMAEAHADALITQSTGVFGTRLTQIVGLASKTRLAGIFPTREFAAAGGLMSYGPKVAANFHRAATSVDKMLQGAKPADLPVEQPTKCEFVINLKTAKALGLTIPSTLLFQANEVIR